LKDGINIFLDLSREDFWDLERWLRYLNSLDLLEQVKTVEELKEIFEQKIAELKEVTLVYEDFVKFLDGMVARYEE